jgi:CRP-like cAMP-binding protein
MHKLKNYINSFIPLKEENWMEMMMLFKSYSYKKGEFIYGSSDVPAEVNFIVKGVVRSFKMEEDGKDFTWAFYYLNDEVMEHRMIADVCVVDYASFLRNESAELAFEVMEDCTVMTITKKDLFKLYESDDKWQMFARKIAEDAYCATRDRTLTLLTKNAKERLEILENYFPDIFRRVSQQHIASYLGITRQSLSRLRREKEKL